MNQIIRQKINKITYCILIISLNLNLVGCDFLASVNLWNNEKPIPINAISERSPSQRANKKNHKSIYIKGKVIKLAPLLGNNAYQIQDDTGKIWVITTEQLPSVGQFIFIKCNIKFKNLSLGNQEIDELYLVELERLDNT
ncbi:MAG: hypothetical protein AB4372_30210 [Xenococcus sp. (in: cyanobacteria)]